MVQQVRHHPGTLVPVAFETYGTLGARGDAYLRDVVRNYVRRLMMLCGNSCSSSFARRCGVEGGRRGGNSCALPSDVGERRGGRL